MSHLLIDILAKKLGCKVCHARKGIYFCRNKKCFNCKYFIDLLKEIYKEEFSSEEFIEE